MKQGIIKTVIYRMLHGLAMYITSLAAIAFSSMFVYRVRISRFASAKMMELLEDGKKFVFREEMGTADQAQFACFALIEGMPLLFEIQERLLTAGHSGSESVATVTLPRFYKKKFSDLIKQPPKQDNFIKIYLAYSWGGDKIGKLRLPETLPVPYLEREKYDAIEKDVAALVKGDIDKLGVILHGLPGNGKSYFIRYLALKYKLNIHILSVEADTKNWELIRTFGSVKGPAIVLMEDFDGVFDKRECQIKNAEFSFDTIINVIDGIFCSPDKILFCMTANHIEKIDPSLRRRPSRFKYVMEISNPSEEVRRTIFDGDPIAAEKTEGMTLDVCLFIKKRMYEGMALVDAINEVDEYYFRVDTNPPPAEEE